MANALLIISALCIAGIPVLIAVIVMRMMNKKPVKILVHGIVMLLLFAIMAFILGFMLMRAQASLL